MSNVKLSSVVSTFRPTSVERFWEIVRKYDYGTYVWRGQSVASWPLTTSLSRYEQVWRKANKDDVYFSTAFPAMHREYLHLTSKLTPEATWFDDLNLISDMQHYGAPTMLLDVTTSPYIGTFFAVEDVGPNVLQDGAIWGINSSAVDDALRDSVAHHLGLPDVFDPDDLPPCVWGGPIEAYWRYCRENRIPGVIHFNKTNGLTGHERLIAQQGEFLIPTDESHDFEENLAHSLHVYRIRNQVWDDTKVPLIVKIEIPHDLKPDILLSLYRMNLTALTLFPGADGRGRHLRHLGAVWELGAEGTRWNQYRKPNR